MKKLLFICVLLCVPAMVYAQQPPYNGPSSNGSIVVATCGTAPTGFPTGTGSRVPTTVDTNGQTCINGTIQGGNSAAGATGAAVPANAGYTGANIGGTLTG